MAHAKSSERLAVSHITQSILTSPFLIVVSKIPEGASGEGFGRPTVEGDTVHYSREIMAAVGRGIWSHHLHSQDAESEQEMGQGYKINNLTS